MAAAGKSNLIVNLRPRVLWLGEPPPSELGVAAGALGFDLAAVGPDEVDPSAEDLFAVLISLNGSESTRARARTLRLLNQGALEYGVLIGLVSDNQTAAVELQTLAADTARVPTDKIRVLVPTVEGFSRILRAHDSGRAADRSLIIDPPDESAKLSAVDDILLRRAFNGCTRIVLKEEEPGRSAESHVWRVEVYKENNAFACEPFVAKTGRRGDLGLEHNNYRDFVYEYMAFPFRAPLVESRWAEGSSRAVLVSMFVGRSQRLDHFLTNAANPELVISALFTVALGRWRSMGRDVVASVGKAYVDEQKRGTDSRYPVPAMLPSKQSLVRAFRQAKKSSTDALPPTGLWKILSRQKKFAHRVCLAHGDLNVGNVFVRWNAVDTILIDFSHSGRTEPLARDLSKLDTSIALRALDGCKEPLATDVLCKVFSVPLLPPNDLPSTHDDGRLGAIRQIRRHACGEGISDQEYTTVTACHLLKFASQPPSSAKAEDNAPSQWERRAACYALASRLLCSLT